MSITIGTGTLSIDRDEFICAICLKSFSEEQWDCRHDWNEDTFGGYDPVLRKIDDVFVHETCCYERGICSM